MARFTVGKPIETKESSIVVDAGLKPGSHLFQLEVETGDGRVSKPDIVTVRVVEGTIDPIGPGGIVRDRDVGRTIPIVNR